MVLTLTVMYGVCMERLGLSYWEVVNTRGLRVQALLGGSNSPTSRCPEAVDWIMCVCVLQGVRTLVPEEGVAYIECARTPAHLRYRGSMYIKIGRY